MLILKHLLALVAVAAIGGCTTFSVVKFDPHVNPDEEGFRYSLPKPFLQVIPNSDGTISVTAVYLPDLDNTFVIRSKAYLSTGTINISRQGGLLTQVTFGSDTSGAPVAALQTGTALAAAALGSAQSAGGAGGSGNAGGGNPAGGNTGASNGPSGGSPSGAGGANSSTPSNQGLSSANMATAGIVTSGAPAANQNTMSATVQPSQNAQPMPPSNLALQGERQGPALFAINEGPPEEGGIITLSAQTIKDASAQPTWPTYQIYTLPAAPTLLPQKDISFVPDANNVLSATFIATGSVVGCDASPQSAADNLKMSVTLVDSTHIKLSITGGLHGSHSVNVTLKYLDSIGMPHDSVNVLNFTLPSDVPTAPTLVPQNGAQLTTDKATGGYSGTFVVTSNILGCQALTAQAAAAYVDSTHVKLYLDQAAGAGPHSVTLRLLYTDANGNAAHSDIPINVVVVP